MNFSTVLSRSPVKGSTQKRKKVDYIMSILTTPLLVLMKRMHDFQRKRGGQLVPRFSSLPRFEKGEIERLRERSQRSLQTRLKKQKMPQNASYSS